MKDIRIKNISLTDFKGKKEESYDFGNDGSVIVSGRNGSGKTTIADAYYWAMADKDYSLKSNPNIRPDDGRECIPRVDICLEIDGKPVNVAKFQKKSVSESRDGKTRVSLTNRYEINGVVKTERDFKSDMAEKGIDFELFLMLSHIDFYTMQKSDDMRKTLFEMVGNLTDADIASKFPELKELSSLLESYRLDEISAMYKATKKKADEQVEVLKNQIIGMEKAKCDESDIAEYELRKNALVDEIKVIENKLAQISNGNGKEELLNLLNAKIAKKMLMETEEQDRVSKSRNDLNQNISMLKSEKSKEEYNLRSAEMDLNHANMGIQRNTSDLQNARVDWRKLHDSEYDTSVLESIKAEQFDEETLICPTCGQIFPDERADRIRQDFESSKNERVAREEKNAESWKARKEEKLKAITIVGQTASENLKASKDMKETAEAEIERCKGQISELSLKIANAEAELKKVPVNVDLSGNAEYQILVSEILSIKEQIAGMNNQILTDSESLNSELQKKKSELQEVWNEIAKAENNVRIDEQIEEAEKAKKDYIQSGADAKMILDQVEMLKMKKNIESENNVNSYFSGVKVKLFAYQKNGDAVDACDWSVWDDQNGKWTKLIGCANTALAIKGKAGIISGLQKFFGLNYPVFVDYAAELDNTSIKAIKNDNQMIYLKVNDEKLCVSTL